MIKSIPVLLLGLIGGLTQLSTASAAGGLQDQLPNVIVIVADDVGYADVGFHDVVADGVVTPNLNRLASRSVVFRNAYSASPVCSNSRLALMTGRYAQRWGAYYYGEGGLPTAEFTLAEMMRDAGYRTMKVGKTHLNKGPKEPPLKHGFDHSLTFFHHSWDYFLLSEKDVAAYEQKKEGSSKALRQSPLGPLMRDDLVAESFEDTTTTEVFGRESVSWIKQPSDKPFYLQLEFNAVHTPLTRAPKQLRKKYGIPERPFDRSADVWEYPLWDPVAQPDYKQWYDQTCHLAKADPYGRKIYLAHLELMDTAIGNIMSTLQAQGMSENTIVVFSSDNGGANQSYANNGDINAYKYCLMNGGIKVPMIVSWPEKFGSHKSIDAMVTHRDLFATLSEITGVATKNPLDGSSLIPLIEGSTDVLHEEPLFWDCGTKNLSWISMQGDWKLVYREQPRDYLVYDLDPNGLVKPEFRKVPIPGGMQLYNLAMDVGELVNLADKHPERAASLQKAHNQWRDQMMDPISGRKAK